MYGTVQLVIYTIFIGPEKGTVRGKLAIPDISLVDERRDINVMHARRQNDKGVAVGAQETFDALVPPEARAMPRERCVAFLVFADSI